MQDNPVACAFSLLSEEHCHSFLEHSYLMKVHFSQAKVHFSQVSLIYETWMYFGGD